MVNNEKMITVQTVNTVSLERLFYTITEAYKWAEMVAINQKAVAVYDDKQVYRLWLFGKEIKVKGK